VTSLDADGWEQGTLEDLVADAVQLGVTEVSDRMITDWTENGLLASPEFQKTTRHGSDARIYAPEQRRLFTELLKARQRSPLARVPHRTLVRIVLHMWLTYDTVVPHAQARRAWRTWALSVGKSTAARRRDTARAVVRQLAHSDASYAQRRTAELLIEAAEKSRNPDWAKIYSALTSVCSPWPSLPGKGIERGFGVPDLPFGVREAILTWAIRWRATQLLAKEQIDEAVLVEARAEHRQEWQRYLNARTSLQSRATPAEMFDWPEDLEQQIKQHVEGFVPVVGHAAGLIPIVQAEVEKAIRGRA